MGVTNSGMPFLPLLDSYSTFTFERVKDVRGSPKQVCGRFAWCIHPGQGSVEWSVFFPKHSLLVTCVPTLIFDLLCLAPSLPPPPRDQVLATLRSRKTSLSEAVGMLRRLDKLICLGMKCKVRGGEQGWFCWPHAFFSTRRYVALP